MLAAVNDNAALGDGVQIFAAGPNCCTVCAPTRVRKSDVELLTRRAARIDPCLARIRRTNQWPSAPQILPL